MKESSRNIFRPEALDNYIFGKIKTVSTDIKPRYTSALWILIVSLAAAALLFWNFTTDVRLTGTLEYIEPQNSEKDVRILIAAFPGKDHDLITKKSLRVTVKSEEREIFNCRPVSDKSGKQEEKLFEPSAEKNISSGYKPVKMFCKDIRSNEVSNYYSPGEGSSVQFEIKDVKIISLLF